MHPRTLKRARKALGFTQESMATRIGVTRNTVERWERGVHPIPEWAHLWVSSWVKEMRKGAV